MGEGADGERGGVGEQRGAEDRFPPAQEPLVPGHPADAGGEAERAADSARAQGAGVRGLEARPRDPAQHAPPGHRGRGRVPRAALQRARCRPRDEPHDHPPLLRQKRRRAPAPLPLEAAPAPAVPAPLPRPLQARLARLLPPNPPPRRLLASPCTVARAVMVHEGRGQGRSAEADWWMVAWRGEGEGWVRQRG
eukprot:2733499-Rhodomonas_salina.1